MRKIKYLFLSVIVLISLLFFSCGSDNDDDVVNTTKFRLEKIIIGSQKNENTFTDVNVDFKASLVFSEKVDANYFNHIVLLNENNEKTAINYAIDNQSLIISSKKKLVEFSNYRLVINPTLQSITGNLILTGQVFNLETCLDESDKFPRISDDELLTKVQKHTFKYFWEGSHPHSGMARERDNSDDLVTTGGTGFGVMAMIIASERSFISRDEALSRIQKIVSFLDLECEKYHGAYAHWINGLTGQTMPFSELDDGADIVETSLLFQGLIAARAYFDGVTEQESKLREDITRLWEAIDWTFYQQNKQKVLYWHWSPTHGWELNLKITGWHEALITYVLAASSPTHPISVDVYEKGWADKGNMKNGKTFYNYTLPLGENYGGPLFLSQYSFLGLNPKGLKDQYADYWEQNRNHTLINYSYCVDNPKGYAGYSKECWGLTSSDDYNGYVAHSPTNDTGVITPSAAISAMPYTPEESMQALHYFYYKLGNQIWTDTGFQDAFSLDKKWVAKSQLAIDQGPIIVMIENYRTGLIWDLFMSDSEIQLGLNKLGFTSPYINKK